jgi:hypothetical protein
VVAVIFGRQTSPPPFVPTWTIGCDHAPLIRDQRQRITALEAENRSLIEQLHAKEERLALYRDIDEAADRGRVQPHAPQWAPEPEDQS